MRKMDRDMAQTGPLLVPVDFSEHSTAALSFAANVWRREPCEVVVLHVVNDPGHRQGRYRRLGPLGDLLPILTVARDMLDEYMEVATRRVPTLASIPDLQTMLVTGVPATRIAEVATRLDASLIVLGSRHRPWLLRALEGSVAERVSQCTTRPVTIVRNGDGRPADTLSGASPHAA